MSGDVPIMLTAKEIGRIKQAVVFHKWILLAVGLFASIQFGCASGEICQIRRIAPDTSWAKIGALGFTRNFPVTGTYSGVQIRVASLVEDAFVHTICAGLFVGLCFLIKSINRRNRILLQYIERDRQCADIA